MKKNIYNAVIFLLLTNLLFLNSCFANDEYNKRYRLYRAPESCSENFFTAFQKNVIPEYSNYSYFEDGKLKACNIIDFPKTPGAYISYLKEWTDFKENKVNLNNHDSGFKAFVYCIYIRGKEICKVGLTSCKCLTTGHLIRPFYQLDSELKEKYILIGSFPTRKEGVMAEYLLSRTIYELGGRLYKHKYPKELDCKIFFNKEQNKMWMPYILKMQNFVQAYGGKTGKLGKFVKSNYWELL